MSEALKSVYSAQIAKTIGRILDELDRAKEGYMALNPDDFLLSEMPMVQSTLNRVVLPSISGIADQVEGIIAASVSREEKTEEEA